MWNFAYAVLTDFVSKEAETQNMFSFIVQGIVIEYSQLFWYCLKMWNKEHNNIISRVIHSYIAPMYIKKSYTRRKLARYKIL